MQIVETLPPNRTVPAVAAVAIHLLMGYLIAISAGVIPAPKIPRDFTVVNTPVVPEKLLPVDPVRIDPTMLKATLESVDSNRTIDIPIVTETLGDPPNGDAAISSGSGKDFIEPPITSVRLLSSNEPEYPMISRHLEEEGVVFVRVTISPYGSIGDVRIEKVADTRGLTTQRLNRCAIGDFHRRCAARKQLSLA